jgi:hypothetical protein
MSSCPFDFVKYNAYLCLFIVFQSAAVVEELEEEAYYREHHHATRSHGLQLVEPGEFRVGFCLWSLDRDG